MGKETILTRTPPPPKAPQRTDAPAVRTMSMDEARELIRKTSKQHAELFRRLAE